MRLSALLMTLLLAAGCVSLGELVNLQSRIQEDGYTRVSAHHTTGGVDRLTVSATTTAADDDGERIARIVWDTYPAEVDELVVTVNGRTNSATYEQLEEAFGPRGTHPEGPGGSVGSWVAGIGFLMLFLIGAVITVLVVRSRRRTRRLQLMHQQPQYPYYKQP
ncbi:hypothetical protein ACRAKI_27095 [Saccharothrix isguenensis]